MTEHSGDNEQAPQDQAEARKGAVSPGEMLRRAREALNLTISDLAGQTRLSRAVLEALERNDFASLAMPVYVRGYFRKCAHVLNVPEDKLLNAYAEWTGTPLTPQPLPVTVNEPPEEYDSPNRSPSWRYALIIAIVVGAALWWFGAGDSPSPPPAATGGDMTTLSVEPEPAQVLPLPLPPAPPSEESPEADAAAPATEASESRGATSSEEATAAGSSDPAGMPATPVGPNTLQLSITATSWVEIYDDDDRRLVYGLLKPGTEQSVNGKLPYEVLLGHPRGVRLSLGGKAIDLEPHTRRDGTARLKVREP